MVDRATVQTVVKFTLQACLPGQTLKLKQPFWNLLSSQDDDAYMCLEINNYHTNDNNNNNNINNIIINNINNHSNSNNSNNNNNIDF